MLRWILLLVFVSPAVGAAQMIRGTVTDAATGAPVKATSLNLFTSDGRNIYRVLSDDAGKFEFVIPKGRTVYVQAERIGYQTLKSDVIAAATSEVVQLNVRMSPQAVALQGVEVVARNQVEPRLQEFMDRASLYKRAGIGKIFTRSDLERYHFPLISYLLKSIPVRSPFYCSGESFFIDNMPVDAEDADLLVAPEDLEGVEVYRESEIPVDMLYKPSMRVSAAADSSGSDWLPPCRVTMLWRKPYRELYARDVAHPRKPWHVVFGVGIIALVVGLERIFW